MKWTLVAAIWILAVLVRGTLAQEPSPAPMRSTLAGVYSAAQADGGQKTFETVCTGCHNMGSHSGQAFALKWRGRPLSDLYQVINETMPEDDPGSLTPSDSAQVVAYLLKANGSPAGTEGLSTDVAELKKIRIDIPTKTRASGVGRWGPHERAR